MRLCTAACVSEGCLRARGDPGGAARRVSVKLRRFCCVEDGWPTTAAPESELGRKDEEVPDGGDRDSELERGEETVESLAGSVEGCVLSVITGGRSSSDLQGFAKFKTAS